MWYPPAHREKKIQRLAISKANTVHSERPTSGLTKKRADSHRGMPQAKVSVKLKTQRKMGGETKYHFKGDVLVDLDGIVA